ncbi:MAG: alkaline phosphatase [Desulfatiglans sp.]|nr:alkaline phosphatase [Desulfatiglans sp.]
MNYKKTSLSINLAVLCIIVSMMLFTGCNEKTVTGNTEPTTPATYTPVTYNNLPGNVKNIILMIPDGNSYESQKVVDYYLNGEAQSQIYNDFPVQVGVETSEYEYIYDYTYDNSVDPPAVTGYTIEGYIYQGYDPVEAWSDFNYQIWLDPLLDYFAHYPYVNNTTDSASAATAMATGYKTRDGSISYGVIANTTVGHTVPADETVDGELVSSFVRLTNITDIAKLLGKASGVVSSVPLSHATPAGFVAHNPDRNAYITPVTGIADEMILSSGIEVIMGPGFMDYEYNGDPRVPPRAGNRISDATIDTIAGWYADPTTAPDGGFTVVRSRAEFQALGTTATPPARVLGIPNVRETLNYYANNKYLDSYYIPFTIDRAADVPTLDEMAEGALNVLNQYDDGFFLMVEGGAVDWANHYGWLYRADEATRLANGETPGPWGILIEEMDDFNKAVEAVHAWVEANSNWNETLLIVVPDHDTGFVWGENSKQDGDTAVFNPVINNGAGNMPGFNWYTWWHSNMLVPLYAKGAGAERFTNYIKGADPRYGSYINNVDIFKVMHYSFLKNKLAGLITQATSLHVNDATMLSRLHAADLALDERKITAASQHLVNFIAAVNANASLASSGMAAKAEALVDAIAPHANNAGW